MFKILKIKVILFFAFTLNCFCQSKVVYKVLSAKDSTSIEYAHILLNEKILAYSNQKGEIIFDENIPEDNDVLKLSHLTYSQITIRYEDLKRTKNIYLNEKINSLDEVILKTGKRKKTNRLLPERSVLDPLYDRKDVTFPNSLEIAVYIPNYKKKEYFINKIILNSKNKAQKGDNKYIPFKVNLMTIDTTTHLPDKKIFKEDLSVGKLENQKLVEIDLKNQEEVIFPKEGICIFVSLYSEEFYLQSGFDKRPSFGVVQIKERSQFREYKKHYLANENSWIEAGYSQRREQCFDFGIEIISID
ncbi:hypothetical protein [Corallibacter vietnamensis]|uniref:Uncharacterized protein n=1 Tax=Corallibacter vietnamensis TaxID=904130 RepID=A0ABP7GZR5_9FLAO